MLCYSVGLGIGALVFQAACTGEGIDAQKRCAPLVPGNAKGLLTGFLVAISSLLIGGRCR